MPSYVAAIDQGTTSTRCIVFDRQGQIVSLAQKEHKQIYPQPGWVEHDPEEIWKNTLEVIALARIKAKLSVQDIAAVGITNQRETTVVWNRRTGKPYYNAIVWQDMRTADLVNQFSADGGQDRFRAQTGLPLATYFSGLKLKWLLDNVAGLREDAERGDALFGNMDTFVVWNLTGGSQGGLHLTDVTNASRTQLMNLQTLNWDDDLLRDFTIPRTMLPQIRPSSEVYGNVASEVLPGVPVAGILGDQQAALVGQTCYEPGQAKNTYGTGCFLLMNTGTELRTSTCGLLTTVAYQFQNEPVHYALEGSVAITGALVQWLRDNLGIIKKSTDIETLARSVDDNGGAYFVPAFSGLYAPHWKADARGVIAGLTRFVNKGHLARAVLEATAYQTVDVVRAMEQDAGVSLSSLRVDGGMVVNSLLMQFQADVLDRPVICPRMTETTALGAAYAAGLAVGYWQNLDDLRQNWGIAKTYEPAMEDAQRAKLMHGWQKAIERSFGWEE
ncbi:MULTISPECIES: glycerol kinase GlpK [unclassified Spirosoma]|uniref:glycerol kinase GlpK n=1 Tax=unclassified Spirosoma TaxID=2621999 RepID=UPI00095C0526|nr:MULTISPECIES: glycerol kinase GlpK [unclassified Spirosoma]MBN8824824.1 glycerol kinase GlpK [Spirosoma sp.]OJW77027.1 MAG: glycerol kinase [Spirosoma sp. 48-14]